MSAALAGCEGRRSHPRKLKLAELVHRCAERVVVEVGAGGFGDDDEDREDSADIAQSDDMVGFAVGHVVRVDHGVVRVCRVPDCGALIAKRWLFEPGDVAEAAKGVDVLEDGQIGAHCCSLGGSLVGEEERREVALADEGVDCDEGVADDEHCVDFVGSHGFDVDRHRGGRAADGAVALYQRFERDVDACGSKRRDGDVFGNFGGIGRVDCDGESVEEASGDAVVDECLDVGLAGNIHCCVGRVAAFEAFPGHARLGMAMVSCCSV